jgi:hypothetical protein
MRRKVAGKVTTSRRTIPTMSALIMQTSVFQAGGRRLG